MDALNKALDLYKKANVSSINHHQNKELDEDIQRFITIAVKSVPSASSLFKNSCIFDSLINALKALVQSQEEVQPLANAYRYLEKYFFLLVQQPWKPEYRTLKMYGGFYKTKVKSVLWRAEIIFLSAGYVEQDNTMVYRNSPVNVELLLFLSFDCFLARQICERISEHHNRLKTVGKTLDDAISESLQNSWPRDRVGEKARAPNNSNNLSGAVNPPALPKREPIQNCGSPVKPLHKTVLYPEEPSQVYDAAISSKDPEQFLGNFKYKSNMDSHIPFMDEKEHYPKLSEGTVEEHLQESLKLVKEMQDPSSKGWRNGRDGSSNPMTSAYPAYPHLYFQTDPSTNYLKEDEISVFPKPPFSTPFALSKSVFSDQGYGTGPGNSGPEYGHSGQEMISETIYRPPPVSAVPIMMRDKVMAPPPVPSRHLKPSYQFYGEDVVDGGIAAQHPPTKVAIHPSSQNASLPTTALNVTPGLAPRRSLHQIKSNSLKAEPKKAVVDKRAAKSMDFDYDGWRCPGCDHVNSSLTHQCLPCGFRRLKACSVCTLDNDWTRRNCDACGEVLPQS